jgi:hypothetical protein
MRFYTGQHRYYCGIDLHTRTMYVCILDAAGQVLVHQNLPAKPEAFLEVNRFLPRRPRGRLRVHLHLVLAGGLVREGGDPPRAGPRAVHESHPRGQSQERQDPPENPRRVCS